MMAKATSDIEKMLDYLKLDKMAESLDRLARTPDFPTYTIDTDLEGDCY